MSAKIKIVPKGIRIISREMMEEIMNTTARLKKDLVATNLEIERRCDTIRESYQLAISELTSQIEANESSMEAWCRTHKAEFADPRSFETVLGRVGFRLTPERVEWTTPKMTGRRMAFLLQSLEWGGAYVRQPDPEPDKKKLLEDKGKLTTSQLESAGICFAHDDLWFFETKSELPIEATTKQEAA